MDGYDVVIVESAISATACTDSDNNIDTVISDLHMPEISGLDLLALLRAQDWAKPFILLSANEVAASDALYDRWVKKMKTSRKIWGCCQCATATVCD